jgi:hypothetical protein
MKTHGPASRRTTAKADYGVFDPDKFWGHVLSSPASSTEPDSFDARIERVWRYMQNVFFKPDEHAAVSDALQRLISSRPKSEQPLNAQSHYP